MSLNKQTNNSKIGKIPLLLLALTFTVLILISILIIVVYNYKWTPINESKIQKITTTISASSKLLLTSTTLTFTTTKIPITTTITTTTLQMTSSTTTSTTTTIAITTSTITTTTIKPSEYAGYRQATLHIYTYCPACIPLVSLVIKENKGVISVKSNPEEKIWIVVYNPNETSVDYLRYHIAGYDSDLVEDKQL